MRAGPFVLLAVLSACTREHAVDVRLRVPAATPSDLVYEVLVWPESTACPTLAEIVSGSALDGLALERRSFEEPSAMALGRISSARATVAAIARDRACAPVLFGCGAFELAGGVELTLGAATWADAPCPAETSCAAGACVSAIRDAGPDAPPPPDAGPDAGVDGGADAGLDGGSPLACPPDPALDGGGPPGTAFAFVDRAAGSVIQTSYPDLGMVERRAMDIELRDLDDDQDLDVTIVDRHGWWPHEATSRIYLREGGGFRDVTEDAFMGIRFGTDATGALAAQGASALWATLAGTARLDLFAGSYADRGAVFRNLGAGEPALGYLTGFPEGMMWGELAAAGDLDGDGALDLVIASPQSYPVVWLNRVSTLSRFVDATSTWLGPTTSFYSSSRPMLVDLDQDGDLDLLLTIAILWTTATSAWDASPLTYRYFENDGDSFVERSEVVAPHLFLDGAIAFGDLDNDGDLDVVQVGKDFTVDGVGTPAYTDDEVPAAWRVLRNDPERTGAPRFTDVTATAFPFGTPDPYRSSIPVEGGLMADFDNDGWLDVYITRAEGRLLPNVGATATGIQLHDAQPIPVLYSEGSARPAAGDLEPDGDIDLAIADENEPRGIWLLENPRGGARVVRVRLDEPSSPNRFGVGAHVRVYRVTGEARGELVAYRHVIAASDQHVDYVQHVALPDPGCYEVEVTWPRVDGATRVERRRVVPSGAPQTLRFPE